MDYGRTGCYLKAVWHVQRQEVRGCLGGISELRRLLRVGNESNALPEFKAPSVTKHTYKPINVHWPAGAGATYSLRSRAHMRLCSSD